MQSTTVVQSVEYGPKHLTYRTFAPAGSEVMRLSFKPTKVTAGSSALSLTSDEQAEGYTVTSLGGGDYEVHLRHLHAGSLSVAGE